MPEITINISVDQMQRLDRVLQNWETIQETYRQWVYGGSQQLDQDLQLVGNIRNRLQQEIDNNSP